MTVSSLGLSAPPPYAGAITNADADAFTSRRNTPTIRSTTAVNTGVQPPSVVKLSAPGGSNKPDELVVSTKPQAPPTFKAVDDRTPVIQRPYEGPVFYTKAGAFSQPVQTLGKGAMVDITA